MTDTPFPHPEKLDAQAAQHARQIGADHADDPALRVIFRAAAMALDGTAPLSPDGKPIPGVQAYHIAGDIYTATVSLNGLKALTADDRVTAIQGSQRLRPL